jgi:hypothetical protein
MIVFKVVREYQVSYKSYNDLVMFNILFCHIRLECFKSCLGPD